MAQLNFTGFDIATSYKLYPFNKGMVWLKEQKIVGADCETNVVKSILQRELTVISVADEQGDVVWVIDYLFLSDIQKSELLLELKKKLCIFHNSAFDLAVLKKHGITLEKVYCTYLGEQNLSTGLGKEQGYHGLQAVFKRRFDIDISKDEQLSFDGNALNDNQIRYAAVDVLKLGLLRKLQLAEMKAYDKRIGQNFHKGMVKACWWDNEFVKAVVDMEMEGIRIDKNKWYAIEDSVLPIYLEEKKMLDSLTKEHLYDTLLENKWVSDKDEIIVNVWSSSMKKSEVLNHVYDFPIANTSKVELKKLLQEHDPKFPEGLKLSGKSWESSYYPLEFKDDFAILKLLILNSKNWDAISYLNSFLISNMKDFCIEKGWLIPANQISINWSSTTQRLKIFQAINPSIESTGKDILVDYIEDSSIIAHYLQWAEVEHQIKNFGKTFYDKHVDIDGKFRTRFNIMLATGRLSSINPNLLNIPRKNGGVFRKAFIPDPGFEMIDSDYESQELVITATISKEPSWLEYLDKGYDLHSRNADLIFGKKWKEGTETACQYYAVDRGNTPFYRKCTCTIHQELRDQSKAVSFGSIYGITFMALSTRLKISEEEAKHILKRFFEIAPAIKTMMNKFGDYGITYGHIIEPVFGRVRFFDKWKLAKQEEHNTIRRASFNTPIQSSASAILKISIVLLRRWINYNNLQKEVKLLLPYHDRHLSCINPFNCGKLLTFINTSKDNLLSLHDQYNDWASNNLISIRQSAAI